MGASIQQLKVRIPGVRAPSPAPVDYKFVTPSPSVKEFERRASKDDSVPQTMEEVAAADLAEWERDAKFRSIAAAGPVQRNEQQIASLAFEIKKQEKQESALVIPVKRRSGVAPIGRAVGCTPTDKHLPGALRPHKRAARGPSLL